MPRNLLRSLFVFIGAILVSASDSFAGEAWVWPTFQTGDAKELLISIEKKYTYRQNNVASNVLLPVIDGLSVDFTTPEKAFVSRMSAIKVKDYEWWLDCWDLESKKLFLDVNKAKGRGKKYWKETWNDLPDNYLVNVIRKIFYEQYVIFTYRLTSVDGKDLSGGMEFPIVFRNENGNWRVSLALRASPLLIHSPWVSGIDIKEVLVN